jgi:hypothetical protein
MPNLYQKGASDKGSDQKYIGAISTLPPCQFIYYAFLEACPDFDIAGF